MKSRSLAALAPLVLAAVFVAGALSGEQASVSAQGRSAAATAPADALESLQWRNIGPTVQAGRVSVFVGLPGDIHTMYVAGAVGGIFKTTNGGVTWKAIFDDQPVASIGAIAIAPSNPNVIYAGTGEGNPRNDASIGDGIYKSIDAGDHWVNVGLPDSEKFARIVVDPRNADVVYACAMGREWGPNDERGLFKTIDGGKSWKKVLYQNDLTGCSDVDIDPTNANIVYAGMFTFRRWAWYTESGGGETAVHKSVDGGATWTRLSGPDANRGLPKEPMDRIGVAVARSQPSTVYVVSETTDEGELWRSDDAGASWQMVSRDRNINFRPFYYADIRVDPQHPNTVYALAGGLYKSEDGGRNFFGSDRPRTATTRRCGSIRRTRPASCSATTAGSRSGPTPAGPSTSSTTSRSPSSTTSPTTCRCPTTCAAGCRTTGAGAGRARRRGRLARREASGRTWAAATGSSPCLTSRRPASSTTTSRAA